VSWKRIPESRWSGSRTGKGKEVLVRVRHFDGMAYDLDPADGHIVGTQFLK
jgi:hypothetical protein